MGDDWQYADDDYGFDDPDYIYAEDSWELADELASNALPQVPWLEMRDDEWDDYDMYEYFEELEYGNDDYYDQEKPLDEDGAQLVDKRKRGKDVKGSLVDKRRKIQDLGYAPVLWMPAEEAFRLDAPKLVDVKSFTSYALLPDWRERFKTADGLATATSTKPEKERDTDMAMKEDEEEDGWEDEEDEEDQGDEGHGEVDGEGDEEMDQGLDPNILQTILAAKMAESGLSGADQGAFMQSLMQMMSGEGADDAALEQLTSKLLGEVEEGGADPSITQWLSNEGVNIDEEEGDDDNAAQAPAPAKKPLAATDSPKDSVAESDTARPSNLRSTNGLLTPTSVPEAPSTVGKKRKKVSFAPPNDQEEEEEANPPVQSSNKRPKRAAAPAVPAPLSKPSTGKLRRIKSKPPLPEATRSENASTFDINSNTSLETETPKLPDIAETTSEEPNAVLKATRKRKAQEIQDNDVEDKARKQSRSFAAPTASSSRKVSEPTKGKASEPVKKTTRSGKERK